MSCWGWCNDDVIVMDLGVLKTPDAEQNHQESRFQPKKVPFGEALGVC